MTTGPHLDLGSRMMAIALLAAAIAVAGIAGALVALLRLDRFLMRLTDFTHGSCDLEPQAGTLTRARSTGTPPPGE